jgi:hypothetical protein
MKMNKFPTGTVIRNDNWSPLCKNIVVVDANTEWHPGWRKVGVVKYDPEPLRIGHRVQGPTTSTWEVAGFDGGYVWLRLLHNSNVEKYGELYTTERTADVTKWDRLPCLPQL